MKRTANRSWQALSLLTLVFFSSALAIGQTGTRIPSGTVTDRQHEPLKGAVIQLENGFTLGVISYITNRDGKYTFKHLEGDTDYRLWVNFRGHRSRVRRLSQFDSDRPRTINFVLRLY